MDGQEQCQKRFLDLSAQADRKGIVLFSDFLNISEQQLLMQTKPKLYTEVSLSGGYEMAERQMAAFVPQPPAYEWSYPFVCFRVAPKYPKYAETLTHRDVLGALMHLGIERGRIGDIVCAEALFFFCADSVSDFVMEQLTQIRHTAVVLTREPQPEISVCPHFETRTDTISSNRIDAIVARAYRLSRAQAAEALLSERVFLNGRCVTNCNQSCADGTIVSVRGLGRFVFHTDDSLSKKGKLRVAFWMYT